MRSPRSPVSLEMYIVRRNSVRLHSRYRLSTLSARTTPRHLSECSWGRSAATGRARLTPRACDAVPSSSRNSLSLTLPSRILLPAPCWAHPLPPIHTRHLSTAQPLPPCTTLSGTASLASLLPRFGYHCRPALARSRRRVTCLLPTRTRRVLCQLSLVDSTCKPSRPSLPLRLFELACAAPSHRHPGSRRPPFLPLSSPRGGTLITVSRYKLCTRVGPCVGVVLLLFTFLR